MKFMQERIYADRIYAHRGSGVHTSINSHMHGTGALCTYYACYSMSQRYVRNHNYDNDAINIWYITGKYKDCTDAQVKINNLHENEWTLNIRDSDLMNNSVNDIVNSSCVFWDPLNNTQALFKYKWLKYESKIHYGTVHVLILLTNRLFHQGFLQKILFHNCNAVFLTVLL